jgi:uncharacterized membrane protein HdeD (DUF308 family)
VPLSASLQARQADLLPVDYYDVVFTPSWCLLGIAVGILAFVKPDITALAVLFYIALWAIATGVLEIAAAFRLREVIKAEWFLILAGLVSVAFGVIPIARPEPGALAVLALLAATQSFLACWL